jgi:hypothetical protein
MAAKIVNLIFDSFLKSFHDKKGNYTSCQANRDAENCNGVNSRSEPFFVVAGDLFGYEVREVQLISNFSA